MLEVRGFRVEGGHRINADATFRKWEMWNCGCGVEEVEADLVADVERCFCSENKTCRAEIYIPKGVIESSNVTQRSRLTHPEVLLFVLQQTAEKLNIRVQPFPDPGFDDFRSFVTSKSKFVASDNEDEYPIESIDGF